MTASSLWDVHGFVVSSPDIALDARSASPEALPDITVTLAAPAPVLAFGEIAPGRVLAFTEVGPRLALTVAETNGAVAVYFHGFAEARLDRAAKKIEMVVSPGVDPALASVWLGGTVMAVLLTLRGHPVLHASAVTADSGVGQQAVAFVGRSGMGKSTMATLACRDGARLLADDVLRTDVMADGQVLAWPGATATRLRAAARALGEESTQQSGITADGRYAARLDLADAVPTPLGALVVPRPDRDAADIEITRVRGAGAVLMLAGFPRIEGWRDEVTLAQAHAHWGALAQRVPVFIAQVPWGPPFAAGLGAEVVRRVLRA